MLLWHRFCEMNTYQSSIAGSLTHSLRYWLTMGVQFNLIQLDQLGRLLDKGQECLDNGLVAIKRFRDSPALLSLEPERHRSIPTQVFHQPRLETIST